jgi:O-antigen/teichoic acid export membrane protein
VTLRSDTDDDADSEKLDVTVGLGRRAARGASAIYAGQALRMALQVVSVSVLARLLTPHDYGLLAIVLAVVGVGEIFRDFGLSSAAVQAPELRAGQRSTLFWMNAGIGAVLTVIAFFGAPLVAKIFGYPQLTGIMHALAFTFLINGMMAQYRASLIRTMRFTAISVVDLSSQAAGAAIAILAALSGAGYWSLVTQQLGQGIFALAMVVLMCRWLPLHPVGLSRIRPMIHYGWNLAGSQLVGYLSSNVDTLTISFRFGATQLGLYNRGFQLLMKPLGQMRGPTNGIAVPILSRLHADPERSNSYVVRGQLLLGYVVVPVMALTFAAAVPIVRIFLGPDWSAVAPVIAALAAAGTFETLAYVGSWVYQARGLTPQLLRFTVVTLMIKVVCVLVGSNYGVTGVAIGYAVAPALAWPLSIWWLSRLTPLPRTKLWAGAGRVLCCAVPAALAGRLVVDQLSSTSAIVQLLFGAATVAAVYLLALTVRPIRRDVAAVLAVAGKAVHR